MMAVIIAIITVFGSVPQVAEAQCPVTAIVNQGSTSGNARAPLGNFNYSRGVYYISAAEMAASGFPVGVTIGGIQWTYSTGHNISVSGNLQVYFQNTTDASYLKGTSWATAVATMSLAHNTTSTIPVGTSFAVTLSGTPFVYTGGALYVAFEWSNPVNPLSVGAVVACNTTIASSLASAQSNAALPTTLGASSFRPATILVPAAGAVNDAKVDLIYAQGKMAAGYSGGYPIRARVTNEGSATITNVSVSLNISGANTFSDAKTVTSIAPCSSAIVTFDPFTPTNTGINTITVSVPVDDNITNNSNTLSQDVTSSIVSYRYLAPITGGVGFNGATGDFVAKFSTPNNFGNPDTLNGFEVIFTTNGQPFNVGIWDDNNGVPGNNIFSSSNQTTIADTVFVSLPDVVVSGTYYVGIRQTGTTNVGFGYQSENPVRSGEFLFTSPTGGTTWTDFSTAGANFRISATVQYKTPNPPNCAVYLAPANAVVACQFGTTLTYGSGGGGPTGYKVFFGTNQALVQSEDPSVLVQNSAATTWFTGPLNSGATYYWRVTAYNLVGEATSCLVASRSFTTNLASCYCTSTATNGSFEHIANVQSGTFSNPTASTLYANYTALGAINSVITNSNFDITVTMPSNNVYDEDKIYVFADFNQDGDFNDPGELCGTADVTIAGGNVYTISCYVPLNASIGNTLLRIKLGDEISPTAMDNDPCQISYTYGEVEDYLLNISPCNISVSASANSPLCEGSTLSLSASYSGVGNAVNYAWSGPNGFSATGADASVANISSAGAGVYSVIVTDDNACTTSNSVNVNVNAGPVVTTPAAYTICSGGTLNIGLTSDISASYSWTVNVTGGITGASSGSGNTISDVLTNPSSSVVGTVEYVVTPVSALGCSGTPYSIVITVNPLSSNFVVFVYANGISGSTTFCDGTDVTLTASYDEPGSTYLWSNGATTQSILVNTAGVFTVTVSDNAGCSVSSVPVTTTVSPYSTSSVSITSSATGLIAPSASVTFTATPVAGGNQPAYQWKKNGNNVGTNSATYTASSWVDGDQINVVMTSSAPCVFGSPATSNTITISVAPPVARFLVTDVTSNKAFYYDSTFAFVSSSNLSTTVLNANTNVSDVVAAGNFVYVLDAVNKRVYRSSQAGSPAVQSRPLKTNQGKNLGSLVTGIAVIGDSLMVLDQSGKAIYRYSLAAAFTGTSNLSAAQKIVLNSGNSKAEAISWDANFFYVLDNGTTKNFFRYTRAGVYNSKSRAMRTNAGAALGTVTGSVQENGRIWITDRTNSRGYSYSVVNLFTGTTPALNATTVGNLTNGNVAATGITIVGSTNLVRTTNETVAMNPADEMTVSVYPNPAGGVFNVRLEGFDSTQDVIVSVVDLSGRIITSRNVSSVGEQFDITRFGSGIYMIIAEQNGDRKFTRVVIQ